MKITSIKTYQNVGYGKKLVSFIHADYRGNSHSLINEPVTMDLIPGVGVRIVGATDRLIVPFPNVAEIKYDDVADEGAERPKGKKGA
jgi:hypothetical protein